MSCGPRDSTLEPVISGRGHGARRHSRARRKAPPRPATARTASSSTMGPPRDVCSAARPSPQCAGAPGRKAPRTTGPAPPRRARAGRRRQSRAMTYVTTVTAALSKFRWRKSIACPAIRYSTPYEFRKMPSGIHYESNNTIKFIYLYHEPDFGLMLAWNLLNKGQQENGRRTPC